MSINKFFVETLGAPPANNRWSWGAHDRKTNRVFLRVWDRHLESTENGERVRVLKLNPQGESQPSSPGHRERRRHLDLISGGAEGFGVVCTAAAPDMDVATIAKFDSDNVLKFGSLQETNGSIYAYIEARIPIEDITEYRGSISDLDAAPKFRKGRVYNRRKDIHARFGGQRQGGISTPKGIDCLFLFTGSVGEQHGYADGWTKDGVFVFYGEGQHGDMRFEHGNLAIREHVANHKTLHLFESLKKRGEYRYVGEFVCGSTEFRDGPDTDGAMCQAIAFHLVSIDALETDGAAWHPDQSLETLRAKAIEAASGAPNATPKEAVRRVRERSAAVKRYVLRRANGICELCGQSAPFNRKDGQPYLEPHHTTRLADAGPDHPRFVGAICPNCHREIHYGASGGEKNRELEKWLAEIEGE